MKDIGSIIEKYNLCTKLYNLGHTFLSVVKNNLTSLCEQLLPLVLVIYFNFFSLPLFAAAVGKKGLMLLECNPWI